MYEVKDFHGVAWAGPLFTFLLTILSSAGAGGGGAGEALGPRFVQAGR